MYSAGEPGRLGAQQGTSPLRPPATFIPLTPGTAVLDGAGWGIPQGWGIGDGAASLGMPGVGPAPVPSAVFAQGGRSRLDRWLGLVHASCRIPFPWNHCGLGWGRGSSFRGRLCHPLAVSAMSLLSQSSRWEGGSWPG